MSYLGPPFHVNFGTTVNVISGRALLRHLWDHPSLETIAYGRSERNVPSASSNEKQIRKRQIPEFWTN